MTSFKECIQVTKPINKQAKLTISAGKKEESRVGRKYYLKYPFSTKKYKTYKETRNFYTYRKNSRQ